MNCGCNMNWAAASRAGLTTLWLSQPTCFCREKSAWCNLLNRYLTERTDKYNGS